MGRSVERSGWKWRVGVCVCVCIWRMWAWPFLSRTAKEVGDHQASSAMLVIDLLFSLLLVVPPLSSVVDEEEGGGVSGKDVILSPKGPHASFCSAKRMSPPSRSTAARYCPPWGERERWRMGHWTGILLSR